MAGQSSLMATAANDIEATRRSFRPLENAAF